MGANRIGDVAELVRLARPTVGLITNAGAEHLEGFGDLDGVAQGEGEMVAGLDAHATAVINADDAYAGYWRDIDGARASSPSVCTHGADFTAKNPAQAIERGEFATRFTLLCPLGERADHAARSAARTTSPMRCGAAAAASAAGASLEDIAAGLAEFRAVSGRLQLKAGSARQLDHRRFLQRQPEFGARRPRGAALAHRARPGWCSATWPSSASTAADSHAHIGAYARDLRRQAAVRAADRRARARSRPSARAANGSPTSSR